MAKLESSLKNMILSLGIITSVAAVLLAGAYILTKDTIDATNKKNIAEAKIAVLPADIEGLTVAEVGEEVDGSIIYKAYAGEEEVGAAVEVLGNGFGGEFKVMVGLDRAGKVTGFRVLAHQETPGLGAKMGDWFATDKGNQQIAGKVPAKTQVVKKGETAAEGNEPLDAITAATISSKAFLVAVQKAAEVYAPAPVVEAQSGATELVAEENVEPENVEE